MSHRVVIVRTPEDRRKPICSCGWQGKRYGSLADAEQAKRDHVRAK